MTDQQAKKQPKHHHSADSEEDDDSKIFPMRLQEILSDEASHSNAICWLPHGRAFVIRDRKAFAETVLPKFFSRKAKYSSFTRKLNRWNFTRVASGPELGAYYHEYFLRDKPHLAAQMFCKNARTKLAMANDDPMPSVHKINAMSGGAAASATRAVPPAVAAAGSVPPVTQNIQSIPLALLAAISKEEQGPQTTTQEAQKFDFTGSSLQLLQRQLQLLQEEQAQRLYMYRLAMAKSSLSTTTTPPTAAMAAATIGSGAVPNPPTQQQTAGIQRMQQLMQMRERQRKGLVPTNGRASAA